MSYEIQRESTVIGKMEFAYNEMNAFEAHRIFVQISKRLLPVFAEMANAGGLSISQAANALVAGLDEEMNREIIFPILNHMKVCYLGDDGMVWLKTETDINRLFNRENMYCFYELIEALVTYQFTPFLTRLSARYGILLPLRSGEQGN